ncbi:MAG: S8 family serine peptidase [Candidatus Sericytochromatia bacterium]|nr:S8 family serine peptidase [Candidatus Sericytochromatia bacterium]
MRTRWCISLVVATQALTACGQGAPAGAALGSRPGLSRRVDAGSVLVRWRPEAAAGRIRASLAAGGFGVRRELAALSAMSVTLPRGASVEAATATLQRTGLVASVEPNAIWRLPARPPAIAVRALGLPRFGVRDADPALSWGQRRLGLPKTWAAFPGAPGTVIAVIDTGVDLQHPDLRNALVPGTSTFDEAGPQDYEGHGTHVAGIVAGMGLGDPGVKGVAPGCRVMPVKVMGPRGREGKVENVVAGLLWAVDHGAKVINMSLGDEGSSPLLRDAVRYAQARDVLVVAASGNLDPDRHATANTMNYPAALPGVMAVGATDIQDQLADFSFWGTWLSITAPGVDIHSAVPGEGDAPGYLTESGTSMAAPFVAGVAGLLRAKHPTWTATQVRERLEATAKDLGAPGYDPKFGHGRVDAARAVLGP